MSICSESASVDSINKQKAASKRNFQDQSWGRSLTFFCKCAKVVTTCFDFYWIIYLDSSRSRQHLYTDFVFVHFWSCRSDAWIQNVDCEETNTEARQWSMKLRQQQSCHCAVRLCHILVFFFFFTTNSNCLRRVEMIGIFHKSLWNKLANMLMIN